MASLLVCWCVLSGMGGTDAQDNNATRNCSDGALLIVLISFPSFPSTLGIVFKPQLVDRALKGDRPTNAPAPAKNGPEIATIARAGR